MNFANRNSGYVKKNTNTKQNNKNKFDIIEMGSLGQESPMTHIMPGSLDGGSYLPVSSQREGSFTSCTTARVENDEAKYPDELRTGSDVNLDIREEQLLNQNNNQPHAQQKKHYMKLFNTEIHEQDEHNEEDHTIDQQ